MSCTVRSPSSLAALLTFAALLVYGTAACSAGERQGSDGSARTAAAFTSRLLENAGTAIRRQPQDCLARKPVTVGRELVAILGRYAAERGIGMEAVCEPAPGKERQYCSLTFHGIGAQHESTAGFVFFGNPRTAAVELGTLECVRTP